MDPINPVDRFKDLGLSEKRANELVTPGLAAVSQTFLALLTELNVHKTTPEVGSLLDELVSKLDASASQHRSLIAKYIIDGKMSRVNLTAAFKHVKNFVDVPTFEKECGVGVVVTPESIKQKLTEIAAKNDEEFKKQKHGFSSKLMQIAKTDDLLKWADGKTLKTSVDQFLESSFGKNEPAPKTAKPAGKPAAGKAATASTTPDETTLNASQYRELRINQLNAFKAAGHEVYPHKFHITLSLDEFRKKYGHLEKKEQSKEVVSITGRISSRRDQSHHLIFYFISHEETKIQVLCNFQAYEKQADWQIIHDTLRRGDIIGVTGFPCSSNTGELSITPTKITLLAPCYHNLPPVLKDVETRYRSRHLDMLVNHNVVKVFQMRSNIIHYIRQFFGDKGYLEVETPTMGVLAGGATAKPFITYHNDLGVNLFMRVAPELYLKQLIIGGMHKVFEIGKNYRNEGIDITHNPEFTAIECYEAYADYEDWMNYTEELLSGLVFKLFGTYEIELHPKGKEDKSEVYKMSFKRPFARFPMMETLEKKLNVKFPEDLTTPETNAFLIDLCRKVECECEAPHTTYRLLDALVGEYIEKDLVSPSFITEHPVLMSPLAKWHRSKPGLTERFELFMAKKEICNAYTELNDPFIQRKMFLGQAKDKAAGDDEAQPVDEGYCVAMEAGLPPTGGWGMGIDRLCMMLTDCYNIKEVILFPAMRPLEEQVAAQKSILGTVRKEELASMNV